MPTAAADSGHHGWEQIPASWTLASDEVHVWRARLDRSEREREVLLASLSDDEHRRAARFHFAEGRNHYIAGRGMLRQILARYLGIAPGDLRFGYNRHGKPCLQGEARLRFNLSHSRGLALYCVALDREVGVDVEFMRPDFACTSIAERFFSANEVAVLRELPDAERVAAFFRCWTRKEAYIKARGKGLAIPLDHFDVSLRPDEPAELLDDRDRPTETGRWRMDGLDPGAEFAGALAVEGHNWRLRRGDWQ
jgi:4'-phosphopantetheinyl transferase